MNLLIISDLHIGTANGLAAFGWNENDFITTIEALRSKYRIDKVILNGDVFELYQYSFDEIQQSRPHLVQYLMQPDFVYLRGNHDAICHLGTEQWQIVNSRNQTIHIEHGHNADFMNGTRCGRFIGKIGFQLLKTVMHFTWIKKRYLQYVEYNDQINRVPRKYDSYKYLSYAIKLLAKNDLVILSHTHKIEEHKTFYLNKKKHYINTGTCSVGRLQAVVLDTETLQFKTIKWSVKKVARKLAKLCLPKENTMDNQPVIEHFHSSTFSRQYAELFVN